MPEKAVDFIKDITPIKVKVTMSNLFLFVFNKLGSM